MDSRPAQLLVLGLFAVQATLLVFTVYIGTPPDELNHIGFIEFYAHHSLSPIFNHQTPTYALGDKTRELDYLYHYIMSLVYRVLPFSTEGKYLFIRLCSVALALLSFIVLSKVLKRLGLRPAVITTCLLIITNLPMVLMMSAAINNDVPVWLGTLLGLLLVLRLWERPDLYDFLWLVVLALLGGLVKRTLLPLVLLFALLGLIVIVRNAAGVWRQVRPFDWRLIALGLVILISFGLFAERVGGNLLHYHTLTPSCEQVQGAAACSVFWVNVRAQTMATQPPQPLVPLPTFVVSWVFISFYNVVDIQTQYWLHEAGPAWWLIPPLFIALFAGLGYGFFFEHQQLEQHNQRARWRLYICLICFYFMLVHLIVNYTSYLSVKSFGLALNGRYLIPSLLPLTGLSCFYWAQALRRHPTVLTVLATLMVVGTVVGSGLIMMLRNPELYFPKHTLNSVTASLMKRAKTAQDGTSRALFSDTLPADVRSKAPPGHQPFALRSSN